MGRERIRRLAAHSIGASSHNELIRLLSKHIADQELLFSGHIAVERVAAFLLDVMKRREAHGDPYNPLVLPMSREDIASRLHVATETVSRALTRLQAEGTISARRKSIELLNIRRLQAISES